METDYSKHTHFRWKIKWRLEHLGTLEIVGETPPRVCNQKTATLLIGILNKKFWDLIFHSVHLGLDFVTPLGQAVLHVTYL